jgi:Ca2+-binding RTX toxin-like protein
LKKKLYVHKDANSLVIDSLLLSILFLILFSFSQSDLTFLYHIYATDTFDNDPADSIIRCTPILECVGTFDKDIIIGTSASDRIFAEGGNDLVQGGVLTDEIHGDEGDDTIQGGEGSDIVFGEDGNDYLFADSPNSAISLLVNSQDLEFEDSIRKEFQLQDTVIQAIEEEDLLSIISQESIPQISLGLGNTSIIIPSFNNSNNQQNINHVENSKDTVQLSGGSGNDHIFGGSGDDILDGGPGKDFFDCNEGIDTVIDYNSKEDTTNINCENI